MLIPRRSSHSAYSSCPRLPRTRTGQNTGVSDFVRLPFHWPSLLVDSRGRALRELTIEVVTVARDINHPADHGRQAVFGLEPVMNYSDG